MSTEIKYYEDLMIHRIGEDVFVVDAEGKKYLFDNVTGSVAKLSDDLDLDDSDMMQKLYEKLDPRRPFKRVFTPQEFIKNDQVGRLMLYLTNTCNMRCIYCHCDSTVGDNMSDKTIDRTLEKYFEHVEPRVEIMRTHDELPQITFMGGGEPFMRFNKIKEVVTKFDAKCDRLGLTPEYLLVTNTTLGSDEDWRWLVDHNFTLNLSLDGPRNIQNRNRPLTGNRKSFDLTDYRLKFLSELGAKVHVRSTVINADEVSAICNYFKRYTCVQSHALEPVSIAGRATENDEIIQVDTRKFYNDFYRAYSKYLFTEPEHFQSAWFKPFKRTKGYCGAVYMNSVVLTSGTIVLCSEIDLDETPDYIKDEFVVASVYGDGDVFKSKKAYEFSERHELDREPYCKNCIIKYKCGGGCYIKKIRDFFHNEKGFYSTFCKSAISLSISYLIYALEKNMEESNN